MAEEEVLGEEEATQDDDGEDGGGGGLLDFTGGLLDSFMIKILLGAIGVVAVIIIVIGVTFWTAETMLMGSKPEKDVKKDQPGALQKNPYKTFDFSEDFIVTKPDPRTGRTRTIKLHIVVAFNQENAAVKNELKQRKSQLRDLIYGILGNRNIDELGYDDKQALQDKLVSEINKVLTSGNRVQDVYFSNFLIQ